MTWHGLPAPVVGIGPRTLPDAAKLHIGVISEHETPPDYHASRYAIATGPAMEPGRVPRVNARSLTARATSSALGPPVMLE